MPKRDALNTTFAEAFPTPDLGGTLPGTTGGLGATDPGGAGLSQPAFDQAWIKTSGQEETANSSGLPKLVSTVGVPDGQGPGTTVSDRGVQGTPMPTVTGT